MFAVPGIPPIFATVNAYVAQKENLFKKYGADVEIRPFDNGTAAARAVIAGDIDIAMSPTPPVINQVSNADVPLVAIYGMNNPGLDSRHHRSGQNLQGRRRSDRSASIRSAARARWRCVRCSWVVPGVKLDEVKQVALGSNTAPAMIAGQLSFGVLHLDDVAVIEGQGKKVYTLLAMKNPTPPVITCFTWSGGPPRGNFQRLCPDHRRA